jgi:Mg2+-importing ATPase
MVIGYLVLIEVGKRIFYRAAAAAPKLTASPTPIRSRRRHHLRRRAAYFSTSELTGPPTRRYLETR